MVKKFLAIFGIVLLLCGCSELDNQPSKVEGLEVEGKQVGSKDNSLWYKEFKLKGHDYMRFPGGAIVHDPECKKCYEQFD